MSFRKFWIGWSAIILGAVMLLLIRATGRFWIFSVFNLLFFFLLILDDLHPTGADLEDGPPLMVFLLVFASILFGPAMFLRHPTVAFSTETDTFRGSWAGCVASACLRGPCSCNSRPRPGAIHTGNQSHVLQPLQTMTL